MRFFLFLLLLKMFTLTISRKVEEIEEDILAMATLCPDGT
jgi:hypothetical protein